MFKTKIFILTAAITCKPKLWKTYVDGVIEERKWCEYELTDHIKSVTLQVALRSHRKKRAITPRLSWIHLWCERRTEQCVSEEDPHRPVSELYLLSSVTSETRVIKPLLDRCNNIVKELENNEEVEHITMALERGGYSHCTTTKMKEQQSKKWLLKHHEIAIAVKSHLSIRRILMHPTDLLEETEKQTVHTRSLVCIPSQPDSLPANKTES